MKHDFDHSVNGDMEADKRITKNTVRRAEIKMTCV